MASRVSASDTDIRQQLELERPPRTRSHEMSLHIERSADSLPVVTTCRNRQR